jgi:hypothetical protein
LAQAALSQALAQVGVGGHGAKFAREIVGLVRVGD